MNMKLRLAGLMAMSAMFTAGLGSSMSRRRYIPVKTPLNKKQKAKRLASKRAGIARKKKQKMKSLTILFLLIVSFAHGQKQSTEKPPLQIICLQFPSQGKAGIRF